VKSRHSLLGLSYVATQQKAFRRAVQAAGHECSVYSVKPNCGAEPDWNLNLAELGDWLKQLPKPLAVLAWNASSSREIIYACQIAGLLVPEEVAVLSGSDDDVLCEYIHPSISGIMVAAEQCGYHAAQLLDRLLHRKRLAAESILVPPLGIITRQSTDTLAIPDDAMVKALNFIRTSAGQKINVRDVAHQAGVCRRVLEYRFQQTLGRSPANEIRRVHVERAKQLLVDTDLPIPDVADAAGFGSPEYMAYALKKELGKTPLFYRKSIRAR
jgi:LacI family transcriptional regulator